MFDQRMYTTPDEADRANLSLDGWLWIPNRCADGTNTQCHLSVATGGCGSAYDHWWNIVTDLPGMNTYIRRDIGYGQMAYENDIIMLFPGRRDPCWGVGFSDMWTAGWNDDPNYKNNQGAQNKAIKAMIDRLKEPQDSQYDLTAMPNAFDMTTYIEADDLGEHKWTFADRFGVLLGLNGRKYISDYFMPFIGL